MTADTNATHAAMLSIPAQHPALAGHFPGNPVVPGVVLLDGVIAAAEAWLGTNFHVEGLSHAKFLAQLKPDETARIDLVLRGPLLDFSVHRHETAIAKGTLNITRAART